MQAEGDRDRWMEVRGRQWGTDRGGIVFQELSARLSQIVGEKGRTVKKNRALKNKKGRAGY